MLHIELEDGDQVVADIGHSGAVTGIVVTDEAIVSGGDDGFVHVRDHDGRSIVPPAHVPEVTAVAPIPTTDLVLVGTIGRVEAVDMTTGRHAPVAELGEARVTAACAWGAEVVVGCADGTVLAVAPTSGTRLLASLGEPIAVVVAAGNGVVATTARGLVAGIAGDGTVAWRTPRAAGEVATAVVHGARIVLAGAGPTAGSGRIIVLDEDGGEVAVQDAETAVVGLVGDDDMVVAACADGSVHRVEGLDDDAPSLGATLGAIASVGLESVAVGPDGDVWVGTAGGRVVRVADGHELPARSSGVVAMSFADDQRSALGVDLEHVVAYDLVDGAVEEVLTLPGVTAVTHVEDDIVVARTDGSLERRRGPDFTEVLATGPSGLLPNALGRGGGVILAEDDETYSTVTAATLEPAEISDENFFRMAVVRREGTAFVGDGPSSDLAVTVVGTTSFAAIRPGMASVTDDGRDWFRVWRDGRWVEPA